MAIARKLFKRKSIKKKTYRKKNVKRIYSNRAMGRGLKLIRDVALLKRMVNAEKKSLTTEVESAAFGQIFGSSATTAASGHYIYDVTPQPVQGTGFDNRTGNSIKWHTSFYNFFIQRQAGVTNIPACRVKIQWIYVKGEPYSNASSILGKFIKHNPFIDNITVYDNNSERKPEYFNDYKVLKTKYVYFPENNQSNTIVQKVLKVGINYSRHVKWNQNTSNLTEGQVIMLITSDIGNYGVTLNAGVVDNVATSTGLTGCALNWYRTDYFYDN